MAAKTKTYNLTYLTEGQGKAEITVNDALNRLDSILRFAVIDKDLNTPPASPADGDTYIVGTAPTGAWSGNANNIAFYIGGWYFEGPHEGMRVHVDDENAYYYWNLTAWVTSGPVANLTQTISALPTQAEVQNIQTKVNDLLTELRKTGTLKT